MTVISFVDTVSHAFATPALTIYGVTVPVTALSMVPIGVTIYVQTIVKSGNITPHTAGQARFSEWRHMHLMNTSADYDCVAHMYSSDY